VREAACDRRTAAMQHAAAHVSHGCSQCVQRLPLSSAYLEPCLLAASAFLPCRCLVGWTVSGLANVCNYCVYL
jgi:hypothetical protein